MTAEKTALIISAHSADFVWRCGGAIALHARSGYQVTVVCLSFGERGESAKLWKLPDMSLDKVKTERRKEAEQAARALNVHDIQFFDLGDYPLDMSRDDKFRLVDVIRKLQPRFMMSHSHYDPYNTDHSYATKVAMECRMVSQAWGHNPGEKVVGSPQLTDVWDNKRAAIECMQGQEHLWNYYTNVAQNRGNHFRRNSGGMAGGRIAEYAEGFQSVFPRTVDEL